MGWVGHISHARPPGARTVAVLIIALLSAGCRSADPLDWGRGSPRIVATASPRCRNAIYELVLDDLVSGRRHHSIVLLASTEPVRIPGSVLDRKEHKLWMSLLAQPAGVAIPLLSRSTDPGITMFSRGELDDMRLGYSDWSEFDSCFPDVGGLTWLSGIGFDAQRRRAMVVVSWGSDEVYSSAAYVLAESEGHWTIVDKYWLRYWVG